MPEELNISPQRQQFLANVATVVKHLETIPGVTAIQQEEIEDENSPLEWRGFLVFAGCEIPVLVELY